VGIDASVLRSRIAFSFDAYHSVTNDLLLSVPLPATSGFTSQLRNIGSVQNNGVELSVTTANVQRVRLGWRSTLSVAHNRGKELDLGTATQTIPTVRGCGFVERQATSLVKVGEPLGG